MIMLKGARLCLAHPPLTHSQNSMENLYDVGIILKPNVQGKRQCR